MIKTGQPSLPELTRIALALLCLLTSGLGQANNDEPLSMSTIAISKKIGNLTAYAAGVLIDESLEGTIATLGLAGKLNSHWYWRAEYFGLFLEQETSKTHDNRTRTVLNYIHSYNSWRLSIRPMLEYRNSETLNGFRFRPEFAIFRPITLNTTKLTPAMKLEPFYEPRTERLTLTLVTLGADWTINSNFTLSANYIRVISHQKSTDREGPSIALKIRL
ncbi:MAG: DUF2490 domain-containing protein [Pseudomonadales bacterium]|nr:DUF2490 domain-containing protein [Pseudomonadales bacterium]